MTEAKRGFFPFVIGEEVSLEQGGAMILAAMDNMSVSQGGGQIIGAGNSMTVSQGGSWIMGAGSSISVDQGGGGVLAARSIKADRSFLGIVLGQKVEVKDSRVLIGSVGAAVAGFAGGFMVGLLTGRTGTGA